MKSTSQFEIMDFPSTHKISTNVVFSNALVRLLSFCLLILLARYAYVITITGQSCYSLDFCFFSRTINYADDVYYSVFQNLIKEAFLYTNSTSLYIQEESVDGNGIEEALREVGVINSIGLYSNKFFVNSFRNRTFDFVFSGIGGLDGTLEPVRFSHEVFRILKLGGFLVVLSESGNDEYSFNSLLGLFHGFTLMKSRLINGVNSLPVREIVFKKVNKKYRARRKSVNKCFVAAYKRGLIRNAEPLIKVEPLKPWIMLKRNIKNVKYLPGMVDISFKNRYVYVDVGSRSYGSSIGGWFKKQYPKQDKSFDIYAIEADSTFYDEYKTRKGVTLLPYAAWIRNETLFFEINREPNKRNEGKGRGMGRIQSAQSSSEYVSDLNKIQGIDFAMWLKSVVTDRDYVVVKMDVEGTEFQIIPWLIETGAICLIDEMFLECHYNRWQRCCLGKRSPKYHKTYAQCFELFLSLRKRGVLVHQWW